MKELSPVQREALENYSVVQDGSSQLSEHLEDITVIGVTGPSAVGTTTIINCSGLYKVQGFTTRPPRGEHESEIRFIPHTKSGIDEIIDQARAGNLVQVRVSQPGYIYGTEPTDYLPGQPNVVDMVTESILEFCKLPIKELIPIGVVCHPDEWEERFLKDRGEFSDFRDRIWDDIASLRSTIEPHLSGISGVDDVGFTLLINSNNDINNTAQKLVRIAHGDEGVVCADEFRVAALYRSQLIARMALVAS